MGKKQMYTQCELEAWFDIIDPDTRGTFKARFLDVVWIPTELAIIGKRLIVDKDAHPENWRVTQRFNTRSEEDLRNYAMDHLHQREKSDI